MKIDKSRMEPIITPEIEELLARYRASTQTMFDAAHRGSVSPMEVGTAVHTQFEIIMAIEHIANDLAQRFIAMDKTKPHPEMATISVRSTVCVGISHELRRRTEEFVATFSKKMSADKEPT